MYIYIYILMCEALPPTLLKLKTGIRVEQNNPRSTMLARRNSCANAWWDCGTRLQHAGVVFWEWMILVLRGRLLKVGGVPVWMSARFDAQRFSLWCLFGHKDVLLFPVVLCSLVALEGLVDLLRSSGSFVRFQHRGYLWWSASYWCMQDGHPHVANPNNRYVSVDLHTSP